MEGHVFLNACSHSFFLCSFIFFDFCKETLIFKSVKVHIMRRTSLSYSLKTNDLFLSLSISLSFSFDISMPTGLPTMQPTSQPTGQPTSRPSKKPPTVASHCTLLQLMNLLYFQFIYHNYSIHFFILSLVSIIFSF